jgi:hypothetical protein
LLDGVRLPSVPPAVASLVRDGDATLSEYLALDDAVLWTALSAWRSSKDSVLSDLSSRVIQRRLFKTYELLGDQTEPKTREALHERAREVARQAGFDEDVYVGLDHASDLPFDDADGSLTVIYPTGAPRRPGDVSYLLGRLRGQRMARVRLIFAPELRDDIVRAVES